MNILWLITSVLTCDPRDSLTVQCTLGTFVLTRDNEQCPFNETVGDASNDEISSDIDSFNLCDATIVGFRDTDSFIVPFDHDCVDLNNGKYSFNLTYTDSKTEEHEVPVACVFQTTHVSLNPTLVPTHGLASFLVPEFKLYAKTYLRQHVDNSQYNNEWVVSFATRLMWHQAAG